MNKLLLSVLLLAPLGLPAQTLGQHQTPAQAAAAMSPAVRSAPVDAPADASGVMLDRWIDLQVAGTQSVSESPALPGPIASKIYDRYANSFSHAIPERFEREAFGTGGSGGGS